VLEAVALVVLMVVVANVVIPLAAPPSLPTPTIPGQALRDCPRQVPGCR
jgi:hypothetical protein